MSGVQFALVVNAEGFPKRPEDGMIHLSGQGYEACQWLISHPETVYLIESGLDSSDVGKYIPLPIPGDGSVSLVRWR